MLVNEIVAGLGESMVHTSDRKGLQFVELAVRKVLQFLEF